MNDGPEPLVFKRRFGLFRLVWESAPRIPQISPAVAVGVSVWSLVILAISGVGYLTGTEIIVCHWRRFTGWPCPLCGGTRMVFAALSGRWSDAFWFNPLLFVVGVGLCLWFGWRACTGYRLRLITTTVGWWFLGVVGLGLTIANWFYLATK